MKRERFALSVPPQYVISGQHFGLKSTLENRPAFVYAWIRDGQVLYVGSTYNVIYRLASHHIINVTTRVLPEDEVQVWKFKSRHEAHNAEYDLIWECKPKYNSESKEFATLKRRPPRRFNSWKREKS